MKIQPKDIIAVLVVIVAASLLHREINGTVAYSLLAIIGAYYGIDFLPFIKWGRNQGKKKGDDDAASN